MKTTNLNTVTNEQLTIEPNERQLHDVYASFCPFGSMDMRQALTDALRAGKETDYVYDCVNEFSESCGVKIEDCDPNYCVLDAILQESRGEIEDLTGYDFCNDGEEVTTYGNFMCSSYQCSEGAKEGIINALKGKDIVIDELSDTLQYFLDAIEITQDLII